MTGPATELWKVWSWEASVQGTTPVWEALSLKPEVLELKLPVCGSLSCPRGMTLWVVAVCVQGFDGVPTRGRKVGFFWKVPS